MQPCCCGKARIVTYSECICSLSHLAFKALAPYCHVACPTLLRSPTLSHKRHEIQGNGINHKMCVLIFSPNYVWNICQSRKNWARNYHKRILVFKWTTRYSSQILRGCTIYFQFILIINFYMFRAGLLLIMRRYYWMLAGSESCQQPVNINA